MYSMYRALFAFNVSGNSPSEMSLVLTAVTSRSDNPATAFEILFVASKFVRNYTVSLRFRSVYIYI